MNDRPTDLAARLSDHMKRRERFLEELQRAQTEVHRLVESQEPSPWWAEMVASFGATARPQLHQGLGPGSVTIVVPIHDAVEELAQCVHSLARHTTYPVTVLLIDDASGDLRVGRLLEMASGLEGVRVLRNVENMGFTATVNRGLRSSTGD